MSESDNEIKTAHAVDSTTLKVVLTLVASAVNCSHFFTTSRETLVFITNQIREVGHLYECVFLIIVSNAFPLLYSGHCV